MPHLVPHLGQMQFIFPLAGDLTTVGFSRRKQANQQSGRLTLVRTIVSRQVDSWGGLPIRLILVLFLNLVAYSKCSSIMSGSKVGMSTTQAARLTEENVGIQEYVTKQAGFCGTLKYRYKDFLVHEARDPYQSVLLLLSQCHYPYCEHRPRGRSPQITCP